jgi:hypothetical protein
MKTKGVEVAGGGDAIVPLYHRGLPRTSKIETRYATPPGILAAATPAVREHPEEPRARA